MVIVRAVVGALAQSALEVGALDMISNAFVVAVVAAVAGVVVALVCRSGCFDLVALL